MHCVAVGSPLRLCRVTNTASTAVVTSLLFTYVPALNRALRRVWIPSSEERLAEAEASMLDPSYIKVPLQHHSVTLRDGLRIHAVVADSDHSGTAKSTTASAAAGAGTDSSSDADSKTDVKTAAPPTIPISVTAIGKSDAAAAAKPVLVMLHGFGGGVGLWCKNFDALSEHYTVYAVDVPGFGRSFDDRERQFKTAREAREFLVSAIEEWRVAMKLDKPFVLLGHSYVLSTHHHHHRHHHPMTLSAIIDLPN